MSVVFFLLKVVWVTQRESKTRTSVRGSTNGKRKRGSSRVGDGCRVLEYTKRIRLVFVDTTSAGVKGPDVVPGEREGRWQRAWNGQERGPGHETRIVCGCKALRR